MANRSSSFWKLTELAKRTTIKMPPEINTYCLFEPGEKGDRMVKLFDTKTRRLHQTPKAPSAKKRRRQGARWNCGHRLVKAKLVHLILGGVSTKNLNLAYMYFLSSSWTWKSRKAVPQRRSSRKGFFSPRRRCVETSGDVTESTFTSTPDSRPLDLSPMRLGAATMP